MLVVQGYSCQSNNFNPRTSYEMRLAKVEFAHGAKSISIHAPRMRCDRPFAVPMSKWSNFNPRTSYEMRRGYLVDLIKWLNISIHAPRMRCDSKQCSRFGTNERFQSTHLVWDATWSRSSNKIFSGHFNPRTSYEMRLTVIWKKVRNRYFNPRTSYEMRQTIKF